jgi:hypothetical protein
MPAQYLAPDPRGPSPGGSRDLGGSVVYGQSEGRYYLIYLSALD